VSRSSSPLHGRLLFVVGARRSGTNWLERILTAHPGVVALPSETYLFSHGIAPLAERFQHANPGSPMPGTVFMQRDAFLDAARDFVDRVMADNTRDFDGDLAYVIERTPWHAQHLALIAAVCPDARVLHIVRDGRDVARSLLAMEWGPNTMAQAAAEWRDSVTGGRRGAAAFGNAYREVVYERLLADPARGVADLYAWLRLELPETLAGGVLLEASSAYNVDPASPRIGSEKWRTELSRRQIAEFERIAGAELEAFGYRRSTDSAVGHRGSRVPRAVVAAAARRARSWPRAPGKLLDRSFARRARRELNDNHDVAFALDAKLADGDDDGALALLTPQVRIRLDDDGSVSDGRGEQAARRLLAALADHRHHAQRPLSGRVHLSTEAFTTVGSYELDDGSHWTRVLVVEVHGGAITEVAVYRYARAVAVTAP
jgi:hypothetical protein